MRAGIIPYLAEMAQRYGQIAKECPDPRTAFDLKSLSLEIANKAHELSKAFPAPVDSSRERRA